MRNNFMIIIFFPVKAEMLLFSNLTSGGHQGGHGTIYFNLKFWKFCFFSKIMMSLKTKIFRRVSALVSARCEIWKEQHLSFHWKKINVVTFFDDFLSPNEVWRPLRCVNSISKNLQNRFDSWFISKNHTFHLSEAKIV